MKFGPEQGKAEKEHLELGEKQREMKSRPRAIEVIVSYGSSFEREVDLERREVEPVQSKADLA